MAAIAEAQLQPALQRLPDSVTSRSDPTERIDASFAWLLEIESDLGPRENGNRWHLDLSATWSSASANDVPWWCWFRDGSALFVPLGVAVCHRIDSVQALVSTMILSFNAGGGLKRSSDGPNSNLFRKPVVAIGDSELHVVGRIQVAAHDALRECSMQRVESVARSFGPWLREVHPTSSGPADPIVVSAEEDGGVQFGLPDHISHDHEAAVAAFCEAIESEPGVRRVLHQDRELIVVETDQSDIEAWRAYSQDWWTRRSGLKIAVVVER